MQEADKIKLNLFFYFGKRFYIIDTTAKQNFVTLLDLSIEFSEARIHLKKLLEMELKLLEIQSC